MPGTTDLGAAFEAVKRTKAKLFVMNEIEMEAKEILQRGINHILISVDPKELGSNEAVRAAKIADLLKEEYEQLSQKKKDTAMAQLAYDLAILDLECLKWGIREEYVYSSESFEDRVMDVLARNARPRI